jgi:hypothetical protein
MRIPASNVGRSALMLLAASAELEEEEEEERERGCVAVDDGDGGRRPASTSTARRSVVALPKRIGPQQVGRTAQHGTAGARRHPLPLTPQTAAAETRAAARHRRCTVALEIVGSS